MSAALDAIPTPAARSLPSGDLTFNCPQPHATALASASHFGCGDRWPGARSRNARLVRLLRTSRRYSEGPGCIAWRVFMRPAGLLPDPGDVMSCSTRSRFAAGVHCGRRRDVCSARRPIARYRRRHGMTAGLECRIRSPHPERTVCSVIVSAPQCFHRSREARTAPPSRPAPRSPPSSRRARERGSR